MKVLKVDNLICGGGMAGMACAAFAAEAGAKTLVVERQVKTEVLGTTRRSGFCNGHGIKGAIICRYTPDSPPIYYNAVVLATGDFQGSSRLRALYLGEGGDNVFLHRNQGSVGDGLSLATDVGAGTSRDMNTYYGNLLAAPFPTEDVSPKDFLTLAQYRAFTMYTFSN
ncbi:uncharacterized protein N7498_004509 [Penicillium cinerascens]|uniref:FAD-dependent oxidoreductase 2 FAD-binding domain-containing protein n=1 Tax=Penicillium cinerascens TaxID=70096 RepID=A0A9W9SZP6_9EURO|nr:uncharacterized protein N7498_004509 [Penicillium cinerascens]KAJ5203630.1 hypothetical protein N7498_004509 [Penicillium cinerascens]